MACGSYMGNVSECTFDGIAEIARLAGDLWTEAPMVTGVRLSKECKKGYHQSSIPTLSFPDSTAYPMTYNDAESGLAIIK